MEIIFLAKGNAHLGVNHTDKDGNIVNSQPAIFEMAEDGPCVAVGILNPESMEQIGDISLYGDWDAAGYLHEALRLLAPHRQHNIPNIDQIVKALTADKIDICDYCPDVKCHNCIVKEIQE